MDRKTMIEGFDYLDELRESGRTNMFGAPAYMERELGWPRLKAVRVWVMWKNTFDHERSVEERVGAAMNRGGE